MSSVDSVAYYMHELNRESGMYEEILTVLGICYLGKLTVSLTWSAVQGFRAHVLSRILPSPSIADTYGRWAVITGCTSGIGRAYTVDLARRGMNVVLISQNIDKLSDLAREVEMDYSVETKIIQVDFSEGRAIFQKIASELDVLDIGVLVNNVGVLHGTPLYFSELSESDVWDMINVNVGAMTMMTRIVLPSMLRRQRGMIVNLSSISCLKPVPLMGVYAATKAYVDHLSQALSEECRGTGVKVQSLIPGYINTNMVKSYLPHITQNPYLVPNAELFSHHAISTMGIVDRSTGYWMHGIFAFFMQLSPTWIHLRFCHWLNKNVRYNIINNERSKVSQISRHR
ncbi:Inactive hydroxysteroid dehydrogenase-like protein 1 [Frankliniella fusca]|uniref:Inactive hydroxysteroid dehydrogenase-like protein 1 n=1 Tax=Frankliniella fusca TaxID=407009 RepID=A0AAE1HP48_9NEOP|nr:Inactive hydroxysteroid dehydrogenase-like protein 1 [Frankliniella fusca]